MTKRRRYHTARSCGFLPCVSVRASLSAAAWRGALSCASLDVRELTYISLEKKLVQQPVRMCGGRESAPERTSKWTSERDRKASLLKPANRRPPCATRTARRGPGAQCPMSCYQIMPELNNNSGLFFKAHGNGARRTNSASLLHGSLGDGQHFLRVQHLLTASFASGVVFTDSRGGRDSLAPKVQKYRML